MSPLTIFNTRDQFPCKTTFPLPTCIQQLSNTNVHYKENSAYMQI